MSSDNKPEPEPGDVWEATSGHFTGTVDEVVRTSANQVIVRRRYSRGSATEGQHKVPRYAFDQHYKLRSRKSKRTSTHQPQPEEPVPTNPNPASSGVSATNGTSPAPVPRSAYRWRVRYTLDVQETEIVATTLLDVASEMEQFAPGCDVVSAERLP